MASLIKSKFGGVYTDAKKNEIIQEMRTGVECYIRYQDGTLETCCITEYTTPRVILLRTNVFNAKVLHRGEELHQMQLLKDIIEQDDVLDIVMSNRPLDDDDDRFIEEVLQGISSLHYKLLETRRLNVLWGIHRRIQEIKRNQPSIIQSCMISNLYYAMSRNTNMSRDLLLDILDTNNSDRLPWIVPLFRLAPDVLPTYIPDYTWRIDAWTYNKLLLYAQLPMFCDLFDVKRHGEDIFIEALKVFIEM